MSGYIFKYQLAMDYFPEVKPETASKLLSMEITRNAPLMAALQATGYDHRTTHRFSPKQQQILFQFLGEP